MPDNPSPDTQAIINGANGAQTSQPDAPQVAAGGNGNGYQPPPNNVPYDKPGGVPLDPNAGQPKPKPSLNDLLFPTPRN
jgi:hypothetical protein